MVDQNANVLTKFAQSQNIDEPLAESVGGATYDYEQDGLGSVTSLTNSTGALSLTDTYDSFGKITASSGSVSNPFQYTGRDFDSETGLYYYRARYYDPAIGRFVSEDPIWFAGSSDFYAYAQDDPANAKDPTGLKIMLCSRRGFQNLFPTGVGNHAFFYDTRNGDNCGKGSNNHPHGHDNPSNAGTFCVEVPGSAGKEDDVMKCCRQKSNASWWARHFIFPPFYDCQTLTHDCLAQSGLKDPGAPGGRVGCPGNCPGTLDLRQPVIRPRP